MTPSTRTGGGQEIPPGSGVVPILIELQASRLKVVGTGFYITRYGLFAPAKHVLDELADWNTHRLCTAFVLQDDAEGQLYIRQIVGASLSNTADVALGQADNSAGGPPNPRGRLSFVRPAKGERLVTYAYPANEVLDFTDPAHVPTLVGNYFEGHFEGQVIPSEPPYIPHPYFETSLEIRSGASGCPVFASGRIVAIACRGLEFRGAEHEGNNLSAVIPVGHLLPLEVGCARIPQDSWEYSQIPPLRRDSTLTFGELVAYGHVDVGTFEPGTA